MLFIINNTTWAVTVTELVEPIKHLKAEIFSGWMTVVKICAAASGIILSAFRGSLVPFGIGVGLAAGIHLYDAYLGDGAAGAGQLTLPRTEFLSRYGDFRGVYPSISGQKLL